MNKEQVVNDLKESIGDVFESIEKIKGERFANAVKYLHLSMHTFRLISLMLEDGHSSEARRILAMQYSQMVDFGFSGIAEGFSKEEQQEIWDWAEQIDSRMDSAMKELNK